MFFYLVILTSFIILPKIPYIFWKNYKNTWNNKETLTWIQRVVFIGIYDYVKLWHNYKIYGLDKVKSLSKNGNVLLVGYHSRCTVDLIYLISTIQCNVLASYILFKIPFINYLMKDHFNFISSKSSSDSDSSSSSITDDIFVTTLYNSKKPLLLLPGGIFEFFKEYNLRYYIQWKETPGFVRVICNNPEYLGMNTKVIPFYTKNCENSYYHHKIFYNYFGKFGYYCYKYCKKGGCYVIFFPFTISIILLFSLGFLLLPNKIQLDTYFGKPLHLYDNETPQSYANRIKIATQDLINKVEFNVIGSSNNLIDNLYSNCDDKNVTKEFNDDHDKNKDVLKEEEDDNNDKKTQTHHHDATNTYENNTMILYDTKLILLGLYALIQNIIVLIILLILIWLPFPLLLLYAIYAVIYDYYKVIFKNDSRQKA